MAYRDFSKEGLVTVNDRFSFSNNVVQKINGAQNHEIDANIQADTQEEYNEKLYANVIDYIQRETAKAWGDKDLSWVQDAKATINFVVPTYSRCPEWLEKRLLTVVTQTWKQLENAGKQSEGWATNIGNLSAKAKIGIANALQKVVDLIKK